MTRIEGQAPTIMLTNSANLGGPRHPLECDRHAECRFVADRTIITSTFRGPTVYRRDGQVLPSPLTCSSVTTDWSCQTCGHSWTESAML